MKAERWLGLVVVVGLLAIWISGSTGQEPAAKPGVAWEYKMIRTSGDGRPGDDPEQALNSMGREGWELAGTLDRVEGNSASISTTHILILKRPKR